MPGVRRRGRAQVETLLRPDLADDGAVAAASGGFGDQVAQRDLAGSLEARLPGLHRHRVGVRKSSTKPPRLQTREPSMSTHHIRGEPGSPRRLPARVQAGRGHGPARGRGRRGRWIEVNHEVRLRRVHLRGT